MLEGLKLFTNNVFSSAPTAETRKLLRLPIRSVNTTERDEQSEDTINVIIGGGWQWLKIRLWNAFKCGQNGLLL